MVSRIVYLQALRIPRTSDQGGFRHRSRFFREPLEPSIRDNPARGRKRGINRY
jgi:hypothetical protein